MKKNETTQVEEKKLIWKMKELPTADSIGKLVDTKVITPEEGREILFREDSKESDEIEALKEMVHALQDMVKDLLSRKQDVQYIPYTKVIEIPTRTVPYWNRVWSNTSGNTIGTLTQTAVGNGTSTYNLSIK